MSQPSSIGSILDREGVDEIIARLKTKRPDLPPEDTGQKSLDEILGILDAWGVTRDILECMKASHGSEAIDHMKAWWQGSIPMLVLSGPAGRGKSHAAAWWLAKYARKARNDDRTRRWWECWRIQAQAPWESDFQDILTKQPLVIEDLGTEVDSSSKVWHSKLNTVISSRYADRLRTVITTNLNPTEMRRYGDRIASRLAGGGMWVSCGGPDLRQTHQAAPGQTNAKEVV